jgi:hypothetical protein
MVTNAQTAARVTVPDKKLAADAGGAEVLERRVPRYQRGNSADIIENRPDRSSVWPCV